VSKVKKRIAIAAVEAITRRVAVNLSILIVVFAFDVWSGGRSAVGRKGGCS
jgi:hypothetical protein